MTNRSEIPKMVDESLNSDFFVVGWRLWLSVELVGWKLKLRVK